MASSDNNNKNSLDRFPHLNKVLATVSDKDPCSPPEKFDPETFDIDLQRHLYDSIRNGDHKQCMNCNKHNSTLTCSACRWSLYCSKECQKKHWKANHRGICSDFRDNRKAGSDVAECFRACRALEEDEYIFYTELRWKLLLKSKIESFFLVSSVIYLMGEVRHVVGLSFYNIDSGKVETLGRFIMKPVDSGAPAVDRIQRGSGSLSKAAKERVKGNLAKFIKEAMMEGKQVNGITCGRGIADLPNDKLFRKTLDDMDCGNVMLMPSAG